jgi:hypothetical protein
MNVTRTIYGFEIDGQPYILSEHADRRVAAEREACAKIAESSPAEFVAREIRARLNPEQ